MVAGDWGTNLNSIGSVDLKAYGLGLDSRTHTESLKMWAMLYTNHSFFIY